MALTLDQENAKDIFKSFITSDTDNEMILKGPPGTGKTYLTKYLLDYAEAHSNMVKLISSTSEGLNIVVTSTTNESAKVAAINTGRDACTIHSCLGITPFNDYATGETKLRKKKSYAIKSNTLIVIDEGFSIDTPMLHMIRESTYQCKVLYIGDDAQTSPIFEKESPLCNLKVPTATLNEIVRQKPGPIIDLGMKLRDTILNGAAFPTIESMGGIIHLMDGADFQDKVHEIFTLRGEDDKILTWTNEKSIAYNTHVRELLGKVGPYEVGEYLVANSPLYARGDIVASTGTVMKITHTDIDRVEKGIEGQWLTLDNAVHVFSAYNFGEVSSRIKKHKRLKEWVDMFSTKEDFADLRPIHSSTVHKAQGKTCGNVFIDFEEIKECRNKGTVARLIYVALTRATKEVFIY